MAHLFGSGPEAAYWLLAVAVVIYLVLVVTMALTAVFSSRPSRRKAALDVLRIVWISRRTSSRDGPKTPPPEL